MPEGRMLKKRICESKSLGALKSDSARLLYTWLIPWLDIEGRHSADPEIIKGHIFPKIKSMTISKITNLLEHLDDINLIILYQANDEAYLQFTQFAEHQILNPNRESKSKIPSPTKNSRVLKSSQEFSNTNKVKGSKVKGSKVKVNGKIIKQIIDYFNKTTNQKRSYICEETNKMINGRIEEGRVFEDFKHVIDTKTTQWLNDLKMRKFLRPSTLFRPGKFEDYVNEPYEDPKKKPKDLKEKEIEEFELRQEKALGGKNDRD